jgi:hypothetical protein
MLTLLTAVMAIATGSTTATALTKKDVVGLFADPSAPFVVESVEDTEQGPIFRLRSAEPMERSAGGALYLRATVTVSSLVDLEAKAEIAQRLAAADPDIGLSYAWDYVVADSDSVVHLHAACTFSEKRFQKVAQALARRLVGADTGPPASFWCRCGGGCRVGAPFAVDDEIESSARRIPPVRRADGVEDGDYDNRLDPSGTWTSAIGDLSLMHYANRLAFSYLAVFGPAAHICEGAGIAGLVGRDRYEYLDGQGTVGFTLTDTEVRMELSDGIASFCGADWAGDRFTTNSFEPPAECLVTAEHSHFHVVDTLDLERTPFNVGQGNQVEVTPTQHTGDDEWLLGRFVGPSITRMGLLARGDIDCAAAQATGSEH